METLAGFFVYEDAIGEEFLVLGVAGGVVFAPWGAWAGGFLGVCGVGLAFFVGDWHDLRTLCRSAGRCGAYAIDFVVDY